MLFFPKAKRLKLNNINEHSHRMCIVRLQQTQSIHIKLLRIDLYRKNSTWLTTPRIAFFFFLATAIQNVLLLYVNIYNAKRWLAFSLSL